MKLDVKDFRIGNLLNYKLEDALNERKEWYEPCALDIEDLHSIDAGSKNFEPIPLTEEWLVKLGLKKLGKLPLFNINLEKSNTTFTIQIDGKRFIFMLDNHYMRDLYFVHEVMNLYYYLSEGQELIIN